MTLEWIHPGLVLIVGAWVLPFLRGNVKRAAMLALPAAALVICVLMTPGTYGVTSFLGQEVTFGRVDQLSLIFSYVFSIMALLGMIYALHVDDDAQCGISAGSTTNAALPERALPSRSPAIPR